MCRLRDVPCREEYETRREQGICSDKSFCVLGDVDGRRVNWLVRGKGRRGEGKKTDDVPDRQQKRALPTLPANVAATKGK